MHLAEVHDLAIHEVDEASRRCHQKVAAAREVRNLAVEAGAAHHDHRALARMLADDGGHLLDLLRELSRGGYHQRKRSRGHVGSLDGSWRIRRGLAPTATAPAALGLLGRCVLRILTCGFFRLRGNGRVLCVGGRKARDALQRRKRKGGSLSRAGLR